MSTRLHLGALWVVSWCYIHPSWPPFEGVEESEGEDLGRDLWGMVRHGERSQTETLPWSS